MEIDLKTLNGLALNDLIIGGDGDDNIFGGSGFDTLMGGEGNDVLRGSFGADTITGGIGDDTLSGGRDIASGEQISSFFNTSSPFDDFIFEDGFGNDVITDFGALVFLTPGFPLVRTDDIDLSAVTAITDFDDLVANHLITNADGDAVIIDGSNSITLEGVAIADLAAENFIF